MELSCPACAARTVVPDDHLPPEGTRARCATCQGVSIYYRGGLVADDPTPSKEVPAARGTPPLGVPAATARVRSAPAGPWHVHRNGQPEGPFELSQLKARIREGTLVAEDLAFAPGAADWAPAGVVPDLRRYFALKAASTKGPAAAAANSPAAAAPGVPATVPCNRHPSERGRWLCTACGDLSCDRCVRTMEVRRVTVRQCPECEKIVSDLATGKVITPFWREMPQLLRYPIAGGAWIGMLIAPIFGLFSIIAGWAPGLLGFVASLMIIAPLYSYHLYIIRATCRGARKLPHLGHVTNYKDELFWPGVRGLVMSILVFLPTAYTGHLLSQAKGAVAMKKLAADAATEARLAAEERARNPPPPSSAPPQLTPQDFFSVVEAMAAKAQGEKPDPSLLGGAGPPMTVEEAAAEEKKALRDLEAARSSATMHGLMHGLVVAAILGIWPIFLIVIGVFNRLAAALHPQVLFNLIGEIQTEYGWCSLFCGACFLAVWAMNVGISTFWLPDLWKANPLSYYFTFIAFYVMGRTAEMAESKLDWR
jgi:predicted Zn finger-like uncharacterized protein